MKSTPEGLTKKTPSPAISTAPALPPDDSCSPPLAEAIEAFHAQAAAARRTYTRHDHRTLFEDDPARIDRLIVLVSQGNYFEVAARAVGITSRVIRQWLQKAEEGDPRFDAIGRVLRVAEAEAEAHAVENVRTAGKDPRFWAAEMTYLERRHPDRWGRRQEEATGAAIVVHVGSLTASDIKIGIAVPAPGRPPGTFVGAGTIEPAGTVE
jgi:transposase-like protein